MVTVLVTVFITLLILGALVLLCGLAVLFYGAIYVGRIEAAYRANHPSDGAGVLWLLSKGVQAYNHFKKE